jgi:hypothetical protein
MTYDSAIPAAGLGLHGNIADEVRVKMLPEYDGKAGC